MAVFADGAALAESGLCNAVVVATPNYTHRAVLEPLFDAGLHILCEKALAHTPADAAASADTHAQVFCTGMEYRYMPSPRASSRASMRVKWAARLCWRCANTASRSW